MSFITIALKRVYQDLLIALKELIIATFIAIEINLNTKT